VVDKFPDFITVVTSDETIFVPNLRLQVYPNPTSESVNFLLEGHSFDKMTLRIFDLYGKLVDYHLYSGNQFTWYRNQLQSGMYVYLLESEGKVINSGKLIIR
ncbi:MAG: T9SS type A sorting domain-containing protein, partial [Haliscomenobacter sp.]